MSVKPEKYQLKDVGILVTIGLMIGEYYKAKERKAHKSAKAILKGINALGLLVGFQMTP